MADLARLYDVLLDLLDRLDSRPTLPGLLGFEASFVVGFRVTAATVDAFFNGLGGIVYVSNQIALV